MPDHQDKIAPLPLSDTQTKIALALTDLPPERQRQVMEAVATAYTAGWRDCEATIRDASNALRSMTVD